MANTGLWLSAYSIKSKPPILQSGKHGQGTPPCSEFGDHQTFDREHAHAIAGTFLRLEACIGNTQQHSGLLVNDRTVEGLTLSRTLSKVTSRSC